MNLEPKIFELYNIEGISKKQLMEHYRLYQGYINSFNEIQEKLKNKENYANPSATYSKIRCLKLGESFSNNGVILHELYFSNLGGVSKKPYGMIKELIERDFGSYDEFKYMFKNIGLSMRGWVVLTFSKYDKSMSIVGQDAHDVGGIYYDCPILVMDVYEHAYMIDYGIDKSKYIDVFFENINWDEVNSRLEQALK